MEKDPSNFFKKGIIYSWTICPNDKHQYAGHNNRMFKFRNYIYEKLVSLANYGIQYSLFTELSEPRSNKNTNSIGPRLHLHGIIKFCSKKAIKHFLLNEYFKLMQIGILDFDTINNIKMWHKYCIKQQEIINEKEFTSNNELWEQIM